MGSEVGAKCGAVSGSGGVIGVAAARAGGGGDGAWSGFQRKKMIRPADRAGPPVSEGEATGQVGTEGEGREVGHGWARREGRRPSEEKGERADGRSHEPGGKRKQAGPKSLLGLQSMEVKENQFLIDFWIKIGLEIK
jgi:hypothetical protein